MHSYPGGRNPETPGWGDADAQGNGYGMRGPDSDQAGYDASAFWSRGGMAHMLTPPDRDYPIGQRGAMGDRNGAMALAFGISAASDARCGGLLMGAPDIRRIDPGQHVNLEIGQDAEEVGAEPARNKSGPRLDSGEYVGEILEAVHAAKLFRGRWLEPPAADDVSHRIIRSGGRSLRSLGGLKATDVGPRARHERARGA